MVTTLTQPRTQSVGDDRGQPLHRRLAKRISSERVIVGFFLCVLVLLVALPIGFLITSTFLNNLPGLGHQYLTLSNWSQLPKWESLHLYLNTLRLAAVVSICSCAVGVLMAWLVTRTDMPGRSVINRIAIVPMLVSPLLSTLAWIALAGPNAGFINVLSERWLGVEGSIFNIYSFIGMVLVLVLHYTPYVYLVTVACFESIDPNVEDASRLAGAKMRTTLVRVVLPLLRPALLSGGILIFVLSCEEFAVPLFLGVNAHYVTVQMQVYDSIVSFPAQPTYAATLALVLMVISSCGVLVYQRLTRNARRFMTVSGKGTQTRIVNLNAWRWPALGVCILYFAFAVVLPFGALVAGSLVKYVTPNIGWKSLTLVNYRSVLDDPATMHGMGNTLKYGLLAATLIALMSAVLSWFIVRIQNRFGRILEFLGLAPLAIPSLSLAIGLIWTYLYVQLYLHVSIYATAWIVLIAYVTRYTSFGLRTFSPAVMQIDPHLEEAVQTAGGSRLRALFKITLPALASAALSVWTLVFAVIILDVGMTVFLVTAKTETLSIVLWRTESVGQTSQAYAVAVLLMLVGFAVLTVVGVTWRLLSRRNRPRQRLAL